MKTYTFIKNTDTENYPNPIYAISQEIEEMRVSDTYDQFGQSVDPATAGDHIDLLTQKAVEVANRAYQEHEDEVETSKFKIGDIVSDYDEGNTFSAVNSSNELEEGVDYVYYATTCSGFNYWDGSNWKSVITSHEHYETDWEIIENDTLEDEIDSKEFIKEGFGKRIYESEKYWIIHDYTQGSFASYELYSKEEYDLEVIA